MGLILRPFDVEAVDAKGDRCPTFEQRVDFEIDGPGIWRGGYNSGIAKSTNNQYLNLECGINRVAVRATRQAGDITIHAKTEGLTAVPSAKVTSQAVTVENCAFCRNYAGQPPYASQRKHPTFVASAAGDLQRLRGQKRPTVTVTWPRPTCREERRSQRQVSEDVPVFRADERRAH